MTASTDILPFATAETANVMDQSDYAALPAQQTGFAAGTALSPQLNKVWRQSSFMAAVIAAWEVSQGVSQPDDGNLEAGVGNFANALATAIAAAVGSSVPSGIISDFGGETAPAGWLVCDGSAQPRSTYSGLYAALGGSASPWGEGDGSTTFNLPDLRGKVTVGAGVAYAGTLASTVGSTGGEAAHLLVGGELPSHTHTGTTGSESVAHTHTGTTDYESVDHTHTYDKATSSGVLHATGSGTASFDTLVATATTVESVEHTHTFTTGNESESHTHAFTTNATGGGAAHNNIQPSAVVLKIIKI